MTLRKTTMKCLQIICLCLKYEPLPKFPYMIRFHAVFCNSDLKELPSFLESCPNLKSLVLELEEYKKNEPLVFSSSSVPECLRSSLEYVELKTPISGARAEMKLVKYFLENSAVLKKFKVCLGYRRMNQESTIFMELLRLKRCSASCELVVELEETCPMYMFL
ncbi:unnamed protein product [Thlaspi arvense]|uniref:FBD domain-containing protein n=1 Tax=Thlaspi arvense TaxID=13288 RepID=A0AAU9SVW6_THLAR|nr:unnamed protein product [Thlaspi arvense]